VGGIVVGASFILAVIIAFLIINAFSGWKFPFTIGLFLGTAICYLVAVIGLNLWAKTFQRKRGIKLDPIVGWKWYVKKYKEIFANEKSRQKKSQQTPKL
jgi:MFS family permease